MKSQAAVHIGLAGALCGNLPNLYGGYLISTLVVVAILVVSSIILWQNDRFSCSLWRRLVNISSHIDVGYTASGFGFSGAGISLLDNACLRPLGIALIIIGLSLVAFGAIKNFGKIALVKSTSQRN